MTIHYVADDGSIFMTEEMCRKYESTLTFPMYKENGERTYNFEMASYYVIMNENAKNNFIKMDREWCESNGLDASSANDLPNKYGVWMYDTNRDIWCTVEDTVIYYDEINKKMLPIKDAVTHYNEINKKALHY